MSSINRISDDSHDATMVCCYSDVNEALCCIIIFTNIHLCNIINIPTQPEYVEMVAADYMRNGLPLNVTLEANKGINTLFID